MICVQMSLLSQRCAGPYCILDAVPLSNVHAALEWLCVCFLLHAEQKGFNVPIYSNTALVPIVAAV